MPRRAPPPSIVDQVIEASLEAQVRRAVAGAPRVRARTVDELLAQLPVDVRRARNGATATQIAAVEKKLGWRLPRGYTSLLRRFGYLDTHGVTLFGISRSRREVDLLAQRARMLGELREREGMVPEWQPVIAVLRRLVPIVQIGPNPILFGDALLVDERGRYYRTSKDEAFLAGEVPRAERKSFDLERFLIREIARWHS